MVCIIQEYAENGDLLQLIKKKKRIDELEGRFLFRQIIEGIIVSLVSQKYPLNF